QDHETAVAAHERIRRFEVAMEAPGAMERLDAFDELDERRAQAVDVAAILRADVTEKVRPVDELHRVEPAVRFGEELVQPHEMRVPHVDERSELPLEPQQEIRPPAPQHLECDDRVMLSIPRLVDGAERTRSELSSNRKP